MDGNTTFPDLDSMISSLANNGSGDGSPATPPPAAPATPPPAAAQPPATGNAGAPPANQNPAPTGQATPPPAQEPDAPFDGQQIFGNSKQNAAFAAMRTQNSQLTKTFTRIAEILGVNATDPDSLVDGLNQKILEYEAKAKNIPVDILERLDKVTRESETLREANYAAEATRGFQRVKDQYQLTDKQLGEFAQQLKTANLNPYTTPMDLMQQYRLLNYDALMEKAKADALAAATTRQQHGQQHSTQPNPAAPASTPGSAKPVTTVADLEGFLSGILPK